ncbi:MAG: hypothetical protein AB1894_02980 [Chloroflexota bacterium]
MSYSVETNNRTYWVVDDIRSIYQALITGAVTDEATGKPLTRNFRLECDHPRLKPNTSRDGLFALTGVRQLVFPDSAQAYTVPARFSADGFRPEMFQFDVPVNPVFPLAASQAVALRRLPVTLQGRVVKDVSTADPISEALVTVANLPGPRQYLLLRTPLYFDHADGQQVNIRSLAPEALDRQLIAPVAAGARSIILQQTGGLLAGQVLRLQPAPAAGPATKQEFVQVGALGPASNEVTLRSALFHRWEVGSEVKRVNVGAPSGIANLVGKALAGEGILVLTANLSGAGIEITDPQPGRVEYHAVGALSGLDGYYAASGLGRGAFFQLKAGKTGFTGQTTIWTLDHAQAVNEVNFRLS